MKRVYDSKEEREYGLLGFGLAEVLKGSMPDVRPVIESVAIVVDDMGNISHRELHQVRVVAEQPNGLSY